MKTSQVVLVVFAFFLGIHLYSQSATSITNGPWLSPFTWNCTCVPTPGYTVTIAHNVTLNTSFQLPSGSITVNAGAALVQDSDRDMWMNGGAIINHGTVDFRYLLLQSGSVINTDTLRLKSFSNSATIQNSGVIEKVDSFYNVGLLQNTGVVQAKKFQNNDSVLNSGSFTGVDSFYNLGFLSNTGEIKTPTFFTSNKIINNGSVTGVDSFTNTGVLINGAAGLIEADTVLNSGNFTNQGRFSNKAFANTGTLQNAGIFTFSDGYNLNVLTNTDSIDAAHSLLNTGRFVNAMGAKFHLGGSFMNIDSLHHHASCFNDGIMRVDSNWFNGDTVSGIFGSFTVAFQSGNAGVMKGSFDFCDLTPPPMAPYIDQNSGSISAQITWCAPQAPDANFNALNVCEGSPVIFNNTSTGSISNFYWNFGDGTTSAQTNPVHTYSTAGMFQVMLVAINGLMTDTAHIAVTVYAKPATPVISVNNDTVSCLTAAAAYTWYLNGSLQSGLTSQTFVATQAGFYTVEITDAQGCISDNSDSVAVNIVSEIIALQQSEIVQVYPNPFSSQTNLQFESQGVQVATIWVYNMLGQLVFNSVMNSIIEGIVNSMPINLAVQQAGLYFYQLQLGTKTYSGKLRKK